ncbi:hypothetical protein Q9Q99_04190 [Curtobacterium flaccumfaciens]|nr:hypothetical protein Q9Q99_04190 [Curtobacterium flaccumfaciens]
MRHEPLRARLRARTGRSTRLPLAKSAPCRRDARRAAAPGLQAVPRCGRRVADVAGVAGVAGVAEQRCTVRG